MDVYIASKRVRLNPSHAVGKGGEADVFRLDDRTVVKVFKRPNHPDFNGNPIEIQGARTRIDEHQRKLREFPKNLPEKVISPQLLATDLTVRSHYYCSYHIFGTPMEKWMDHPGMMAVDPAFSGLRLAGGGVACDVCVYYKGTGNEEGFCVALAPEEGVTGPAKVAAKAMCARFRVS